MTSPYGHGGPEKNEESGPRSHFETSQGLVVSIEGLGRLWVPHSMKEDLVLRELAAGREWDAGSTDIYRSCVRPGDVVMDVGAFNGVRTLRLAQLVGTNGRVYAWEPQEAMRDQLRANLILNGVTQVVVMPFAASSTRGNRAFWLNPSNRGGSSLHRGQDTRYPGGSVQTLPIDNALPPQRVSFLKIDVEGHEQEVLRGARTLLERDRPTLYIEIWADPQRQKEGATDSTAEVFGLLEELGYPAPPPRDWSR